MTDDISSLLPLVLPGGWRVVEGSDHHRVYRTNRGTVIASIGPHSDGREWMHVSVAHDVCIPSWDDLVFLKHVLLPDHTAIQIFPPRARWVNIHSNCLHLWSPIDRPLDIPDFAGEGEKALGFLSI